MDSHNHHPVDVDPQALHNARAFWHNFTKMTQFSVIAAIIILGLMAYFLV